MSERDPRALLVQADRAKEVARWAESMRVTIRLGRPVKVSEMHQRGPFGRKREYLFELDDRMPGPAVDALYRALAMVRDEANAEAYACEHLVTTRPDGLRLRVGWSDRSGRPHARYRGGAMSGEELRTLAERATPGPWEVIWNAVAYVDTVADPNDPTGQTPMQEPVKVADASEHDRNWIAAANPTAVLALLAERDALRAQVERVANETSRFARWSGEVADESADRAVAYQIVVRRLRDALDGPQ